MRFFNYGFACIDSICVYVLDYLLRLDKEKMRWMSLSYVYYLFLSCSPLFALSRTFTVIEKINAVSFEYYYQHVNFSVSFSLKILN